MSSFLRLASTVVLQCQSFHIRGGDLAIDTLEMLIASEPLVAEAFKATITSLSSECLDFLITGDMAYGVYGNARFTRTLDILAHQELRSGVADSLLWVGLHSEFRYREWDVLQG